MSLSGCLFEKDISKIGFVYVNGVEKSCSSGLILALMPDLDIVIHYTVWCPKLVISLRLEKRRRMTLVEKPFYYSRSVLPVSSSDYLNEHFDDLEDSF
jgi:hypothetical protein